MKLVNAEYGLDIDFKENEVYVVIIEHPIILSEIIDEIYRQSNGGDGNFVISENDKLLTFNKEIALILEPFTINCNDKRILTRLYQELKTQVDEYMSEETMNLNSIIYDYLDKATLKVPYLTTYKLDFDIAGLFKLLDVELECIEESLFEKIINYVKAITQLCGFKYVIFLNLKNFLTINELKSLYEFAFYNKISLILLESSLHTIVQGEKTCIIDKDRCLIYC